MNTPTHLYLSTDKIDAINNIATMFTLRDDEREDLKKCVNSNFNVDRTMLEWSVKRGKLPIAKYLLETNRAKLDHDNNHYLLLAAMNGHTEIVELLIKHGININTANDKALVLAAENGHIDIVKILVTNGANIATDKCAAIINSIVNNHTSIAKFLIENNTFWCYNDSILCASSESGNLEIMQMAVEIGANVNYLNDAALKKNIEHRREAVVKFLAETYVEKNIPIPDEVIIGDLHGMNRILILYATQSQYELFDPELVKTLVSCKSAKNI